MRIPAAHKPMIGVPAAKSAAIAGAASANATSAASRRVSGA
jgi:hypothetical protein